MTASKELGPFPVGLGRIFIQNQFLTKLPKPPKETDLRGKVAIVTGSNTGLGFEGSRQMLELGLSHLVMGVRSLEKGNAAARNLQLANPNAKIDVWQLEMESYPSIQQFASRCDRELARIDNLILNAGLMSIDFVTTPSTGHERTMQVNYLSTVLLLLLLLPVLKAKKQPGQTPPRISLASSLLAETVKLANRNMRPLLASFDDVTTVPYEISERYGVSKLFGQLFITRLADMVDPDEVVLNMMDPGLTKQTSLGKTVRGVMRIAQSIFLSAAGRPVKEGARSYIDAAFVQDGHGSHGSFLMNCKIAPLGALAYTPDGESLTNQIWEETLDELGFAGVREVLRSFAK